MNKFAERLKKLMVYKGVSQTELSLLIGVREQTISKWLHKKYEPEFENLIKICRVFGYKPELHTWIW